MTNLLSVGRDIQWSSVGIAVAIMVGAAALLGVCIMLISKLCKVDEDPRIAEVTGCLAGANCGACGYAGCSGYAKALVEGKAGLDACGQTGADKTAEICNILGIEAEGGLEPTVAVVACCGGTEAVDRFEYSGCSDCVSQNALKGGKKLCSVGCLGGGTCAEACPYGAMNVGQNQVAKVTPELCVSCGLCINACPKKIVRRIPKSAKVYVACRSQCRGKEVMTACQNGCIACSKCARNCPEQAITMVDNLPVIDYSKCVSCGKCVTDCPRGTIKYVG